MSLLSELCDIALKKNLKILISSLTKQNFHSLCDRLAKKDPHLNPILKKHGYPPLWTRTPSFQTLIHIILEQQVSLASARAAFNKLKEKTGKITAKNLLALSDEELRSCYFSRQKTIYGRELAKAVATKKISLKKLSTLEDTVIRQQLKMVKGIGDWTVDVYLLFALQRPDVFPVGDLAMIKAFREVKNLPAETNRDEILKMAEEWRPYRSVATMMLWHYYIEERRIQI